MVTNGILEQFKDRMHISSNAEDVNLTRMLISSYKRITDICDKFDLEEEGTGKDLVFERARYMYNDALEYFEDNFLTTINGFALSQLSEVPNEEV